MQPLKRRRLRRPEHDARRRGGLAVLALVSVAACGGERDTSRATPEAAGPSDLAALGYATWDEPEAAPPVGAVLHDAARIAPGWNVYADDVDRVVAVDVHGVERRTWRVPGRTQVEYAKVLEGGRVLALSVDEGLTLLEPDGALVWHVDLAGHHDVTVRPGDPPGQRTFAVATHTEREHRGRRVRFDEVRCVDEATGAVAGTPALDSYELREAWLAPFAAAGREHPLDTPPRAPSDTVYDYFHLNSLEWERDAVHGDSLLLCLRNVDTVASVRFPAAPDRADAVPGEFPGEFPGAVLWHADVRALDWPHMPRRLAPRAGASAGDVLVFDNGRHRGWSRLVTCDAEGGVHELWAATPREAFFSDVRGGVQRLSNGNTLVTESERGRVFELAPDGAVVWEYWNPVRRGGAVRRIYRAERYPEALF